MCGLTMLFDRVPKACLIVYQSWGSTGDDECMERTGSFFQRTYRNIPLSFGRTEKRARSILLPIPTDIPLVLTAAGFLLGRSAIFGELWPFGLAYLGALRATGPKSKAVMPLLGILVGLIPRIGLRNALPYFAAFVLLWMVKEPSIQSCQYWNYWLVGSLLFLKAPLHFLLQPVPMVFIVGLTECALAVISYKLICMLLCQRTTEGLAYRETQWVLLLFSAVLAGDIYWNGFSLRLFLIFYLTIGAARLGGITMSSLVGSGLGLVCLLLGECTLSALVVVTCGLLTGALSKLSWGLVLGPILAALLGTGGPASAQTVQTLLTACTASLAVRFTPGRIWSQLARVTPGTHLFQKRQDSYTERLRDVMDQKMEQCLSMFQELTATMQGTADPFMAQQLQGMTEVLETMKKGFAPGIQFAEHLEEKILHQFRGENIAYITVLSGADGFDIFGALQNACEDRRWCEQVANYCTGTVDSQRYGVANRMCTINGACGFKIVPRPRYQLEIGKAKIARQDVSGDSQVTFDLASSKVAILLSDGMGVGSRAQQESSVAIRLLEQMIRTGYSLQVAVSLVNRVLVLRNRDEMFVTIDLVVVDLYTGQLEFVKIGSAPSFIKRGREIEVIHNNSLPAGVLSQVHVEPDRRLLKEGEVLVMATDGILEVHRNIIRKDEWMCWNLRRIEDSTDLATMAEQLLADSLRVVNGQVEDDMMVVVARLIRTDWEIDTYRRTQSSV